MKTSFKILFILIFVFSITSCRKLWRPEQLTIKIIETSDVHGAIMPFDLREDRPAQGSLAQLMTLIKDERNKPEQVVILLDNGDILQGDPLVYYYNFIDTVTEHICSRVMNHMKYDAATIGNHDIEPGHAVYDRLKNEFGFDWLAANALSKKTGKPYFKPYSILEREGIRIAVLGMITPAIPQWLPEKAWQGIEFEDMLVSAKKWTDHIIRYEKPDLLIGLFHSGAEVKEVDTGLAFPEENASRLIATRVPGFDIVFAGHDHRGWNEQVKNLEGNMVRLLAPLSRAKNVAVAQVIMTYNKHTHRYDNEITGDLIDILNIEPDKNFMYIFTPSLEKARSFVSQRVGYFSESISSRDAFFGDAAFTDLIHRFQLEYTGAAVSFTAPLSKDVTITKGDFFVRDLFNLYRFENLLYTIELSGKEIHDYLEYSSGLWFNQMQLGTDHLLRFRTDSSGNLYKSVHDNSNMTVNPYYDFDTGEGINYDVDVSKPSGSMVSIRSMAGGSPFDPAKKYRVVVNSYRGNGGGGHLTNGIRLTADQLKSRIIAATSKDIRFLLMQWIGKQDTIKPFITNNWRVVPENLHQQGYSNDYHLLFGESPLIK